MMTTHDKNGSGLDHWLSRSVRCDVSMMEGRRAAVCSCCQVLVVLPSCAAAEIISQSCSPSPSSPASPASSFLPLSSLRWSWWLGFLDLRHVLASLSDVLDVAVRADDVRDDLADIVEGDVLGEEERVKLD